MDLKFRSPEKNFGDYALLSVPHAVDSAEGHEPGKRELG